MRHVSESPRWAFCDCVCFAFFNVTQARFILGGGLQFLTYVPGLRHLYIICAGIRSSVRLIVIKLELG